MSERDREREGERYQKEREQEREREGGREEKGGECVRAREVTSERRGNRGTELRHVCQKKQQKWQSKKHGCNGHTHTLPKSSRSCGELSFKRNEMEMEMERERGGMGKSEVARVTGQEHTRTSQEHQRQHEEAQRRGEATEHTCPRSRRIFAVSSSRAHASGCVRLCVRVRV